MCNLFSVYLKSFYVFTVCRMKIVRRIIVGIFVVLGVVFLALILGIKLFQYNVDISSNGDNIKVNLFKNNKARLKKRVELLRTSGEFKFDSAFVAIDYIQDSVRANEIAEYFQLDTLYSSDASTWDKALAIGKFVASNIPHDNQRDWPEYVNAIGLWEYTKNVAPAFNCRLHSIMTFELLMSAGITARYVTCFPQDKNDSDCHVMNEVWLPELGKWVMLDTDMGGHYVTDTKGNLLSLLEIREHYIAGKKMMMYPNFVNGSSKVDDYYAYLAKNTYWFTCWGNLGYYQEDYNSFPENPLRKRCYALVPSGFEPFVNFNYVVTHDAEQFWMGPQS